MGPYSKKETAFIGSHLHTHKYPGICLELIWKRLLPLPTMGSTIGQRAVEGFVLAAATTFKQILGLTGDKVMNLSDHEHKHYHQHHHHHKYHHPKSFSWGANWFSSLNKLIKLVHALVHTCSHLSFAHHIRTNTCTCIWRVDLIYTLNFGYGIA